MKKIVKKKSTTKKVAKKTATKSTWPGKYDPHTIEKKWQEFWQKEKIFKAPESKTEKKYILIEFPYPSAEGLHMGHLRPYVAGDIYSRFLRHRGFNVLYPIGWDAFGLPAENYAIKQGIHPRLTTAKNIENAKRQLISWGLSFDWSREINTTDPEYYKWTQWIFLQFYKAGLAYEQLGPINWCPSCKTGLANEEVVDGKCERCGTVVETKKLRQWMLKITAYAEKLLQGLEELQWPEYVKRGQIEWIGRKDGVKIFFGVRGTEEKIDIFTTRVDTLFGATFLVLSPEHKNIEQIATPAQSEAVKLYLSQTQNKSQSEREADTAAAKTGVFTGAYAINPLTLEEIPIWISDYVMAGVGSGAIMAVPAHDTRDYEFAKAHDLPIRPVVLPEEFSGDLYAEDAGKDIAWPYTEEGILIDSGGFTGMHSDEARKNITAYLERRGEGERAITYRLRDWVFSRQRYWGEPIPLIHCQTCGIVPVPEDQLPVLLPEVERYEPTGTGESPLAAIEDWVQTSCPKCGEQARRETNTMPQWAGSSWYWLRFSDPQNNDKLASKENLAYWQPVDMYFGGMEHTTLHLLYARFWNRFLYDQELVTAGEPFVSRQPHGIILAEDGEKMSKSRGNIVNPDDIAEKYGADTLRTYEMFLGPYENSVAWNDSGLVGVRRFLDRIWQIGAKTKKWSPRSAKAMENDLQALVNKVTSDIEGRKFNTAVAALMEFSHKLAPDKVSKKIFSTFVILLHPFAPHITEEVWALLGNKKSVQLAVWPESKEVNADKKVKLALQVNGKLRDIIEIEVDATQEKAVNAALKSEKAGRYIAEPEKAKIVYVPGKILNFVIDSAKGTQT